MFEEGSFQAFIKMQHYNDEQEGPTGTHQAPNSMGRVM
jgi:hypothetical protein